MGVLLEKNKHSLFPTISNSALAGLILILRLATSSGSSSVGASACTIVPAESAVVAVAFAGNVVKYGTESVEIEIRE